MVVHMHLQRRRGPSRELRLLAEQLTVAAGVGDGGVERRELDALAQLMRARAAPTPARKSTALSASGSAAHNSRSVARGSSRGSAPRACGERGPEDVVVQAGCGAAAWI
jgi:hypothetical protein